MYISKSMFCCPFYAFQLPNNANKAIFGTFAKKKFAITRYSEVVSDNSDNALNFRIFFTVENLIFSDIFLVNIIDFLWNNMFIYETIVFMMKL